jgi:hypothetical protein
MVFENYLTGGDIHFITKQFTLTVSNLTAENGPCPGATKERGKMSDITYEEYETHKGNVRLQMYRKRLTGGGDRPVLFLVHGSSMSALGAFDLRVPGDDTYFPDG